MRIPGFTKDAASALLNKMWGGLRGPKYKVTEFLSAGRLGASMLLTEERTDLPPVDRFAKISTGGVDNPHLAALVANVGKNHNMPFARVFPGKNGSLVQRVHQNIDGNKLPYAILGKLMTLEECSPHLPHPDAPDILVAQAIGRYAGSFNRLSKLQGHFPRSIPASDLLSIDNTKRDLLRMFKIDPIELPNVKRDRLKRTAEEIAPDSKIEEDFALSIAQGLPLKMISSLIAVQQELRGLDLPNGIVHNDIKTNNQSMTYDEGLVRTVTGYDLGTVSAHTARVKDLGRIISFEAFDKKSGLFNPAMAEALISGWLEQNPLNADEIRAIEPMVKLGIITSFRLRSGYIINKGNADIDLLDPTVHAKELENFEQWSQQNDVGDMARNLQEQERYKRFAFVVRLENDYRNTTEYNAYLNDQPVTRKPGPVFKTLDAASDYVRTGNEGPLILTLQEHYSLLPLAVKKGLSELTRAPRSFTSLCSPKVTGTLCR